MGKRFAVIVAMAVCLIALAVYGTRYQVLYADGNAVFLLNRWTGATTLATPMKGLASQADMRLARERVFGMRR